jgi:hypothetical protein
MTTPSEQSSISPLRGNVPEQPERFGPPDVTNLASLTDGRAIGQYQSAYSFGAWVQIVGELAYLLIVLGLSFAGLVLLAKYVVLRETSGPVFALIGSPTESTPLVVYAAVILSGICGGCASSLKWLYHSVAKQRWHRDRLIWRLIVPPLSGVLAVFTALMIISGIVPFLNRTSLAGPASGAALGFFVGLFSDNLLAALQKVAFRAFGTVDVGTTSKTEQSQTGAFKAER